MQALAEQRRGGETGVRAVRCLSGDAVWTALDQRLLDPELVRGRAAPGAGLREGRGPRTARPCRSRKLMIVEYEDGLRAFLLELNGAVGAWTAAWRYEEDRRIESTQFWTQEARPAAHFTLLLNGIESMMLTGKPAWPVERTLLTSGTLDALLQSHTRGGDAIADSAPARLPTGRPGGGSSRRRRRPGRPWSEQ